MGGAYGKSNGSISSRSYKYFQKIIRSGVKKNALKKMEVGEMQDLMIIDVLMT